MRLVAAGSLAAFVALICATHLIEPDLNPLRHQVSEYANAPRTAWLASTAFACWALSLACTGALARREHRPGLAASLVVASVGVVTLMAFSTDTVAGELPPGAAPTTAGRLHDIGSGLTSLALLAAVVLSARRRTTRLLTVAVASCLLAMASSGALLAVGAEVGGLRQRILIALGCIWQLAYLSQVRPAAPADASDGRHRGSQRSTS